MWLKRTRSCLGSDSPDSADLAENPVQARWSYRNSIYPGMVENAYIPFMEKVYTLKKENEALSSGLVTNEKIINRTSRTASQKIRFALALTIVWLQSVRLGL